MASSRVPGTLPPGQAPAPGPPDVNGGPTIWRCTSRRRRLAAARAAGCVGAWELCPRLPSRDQVCWQGCEVGGNGGRFEPSILILDFFFLPLASAPGGMTAACPPCKIPASQPASLAPPIAHYPTQPFEITAYLGTLALLAIGLPGCVIRAARIHLLAPSCLADRPTDRLTSTLPGP